VQAASGHYAFVAHTDACFGLERENHGSDEVIVFGGVSRNASPRMLVLDEDEETLRFSLAEGEGAEKIFTPAEFALWEAIRRLPDRFSFGDVLLKTGTKNRKAVSSMLRKAKGMNLISQAPDRTYRICS
jgi:hypothetical protein